MGVFASLGFKPVACLYRHIAFALEVILHQHKNNANFALHSTSAIYNRRNLLGVYLCPSAVLAPSAAEALFLKEIEEEK